MNITEALVTNRIINNNTLTQNSTSTFNNNVTFNNQVNYYSTIYSSETNGNNLIFDNTNNKWLINCYSSLLYNGSNNLSFSGYKNSVWIPLIKMCQDGSLVLTISSLITQGIYNLCQLHQYGPSLFSDIITVNNLSYFNNTLTITKNSDQLEFINNNNNWKFSGIDYAIYNGKNNLILYGTNNTQLYQFSQDGS